MFYNWKLGFHRWKTKRFLLWKTKHNLHNHTNDGSKRTEKLHFLERFSNQYIGNIIVNFR